MTKQVSYFTDLTNVSADLALDDVLSQIQSDVYKEKVSAVRALIDAGKLDEAGRLKRCLPAFTPSGTFLEKRNKSSLSTYTQLVVLDFDKLQSESLAKLKEQMKDVAFVYAFFVSPSGNGLKVLVVVDSNAENHELAFQQVVKVVEEICQVAIDRSGKDVSRLCFFSYDPDLYVNNEVIPFSVQMSDALDFDSAIVQARLVTEQKNDYQNGNRNNFVYALACNANRMGVPKEHTLQYVNDNFDLNEQEVDSAIMSAYQSHSKEHGSVRPKKPQIDIVEEMLTSRFDFRFNEITSKVEYMDRENGTEEYEELTDYKENSIWRWFSKKGTNVTQTRLRSIVRSDFSKLYNPFKAYFKRLPAYDGGTDYIGQLAATVSTHDDVLWNEVFRKWLVGLVACATSDNINHTVLVFAGEQGIGKTTWMLNLIPPELQKYIYSGIINPNNKDTLTHLSECILINLDELESLNKSEIGSLKEIITKDAIRLRKAYGVNNENLTRRASFSGSVNSLQFLNDMTGSRRFLCFEVYSADYSGPVDYTGVYSQALHLFRTGFQYWLSQDEIEKISSNNEKFQLTSQEEELLLAYFEPCSIEQAKLFLTNTEILNKIKTKTGMSNNSIRQRALGNALSKHGFIRMKRNGQQVYPIYEKSLVEIDRQFRKE